MRKVLLLGMILSCISLFAQKVKTVSAEYTYYAPETMSVEEAKRIALDRAKIQAIADEFGTIVSQSTSTIISNKNGESDSQFFAFGGSEVKGEWIETIGDPKYNMTIEDHLLVIYCKIKGKIREFNRDKIEFTALPLRNGTTLRYESYEFRNGDDLYLYFKSPVDGFLSIYLLDELCGFVYHILPYKSQDKATTIIQANNEYVFFSKAACEKTERKEVDEYILTTDNTKEFNTLYILFSTQELGIQPFLEKQNSSTPGYTSFKEFQNWLSKTLMTDNRIQLKQILLAIDK